MLRTVLSRTVSGILCLACLTTLTACGLKGPLYLPERTATDAMPQSTPLSTPAPAQAPVQGTSPFGDDPETEAPDAGKTGTQAGTPSAPKLESSTSLAQ